MYMYSAKQILTIFFLFKSIWLVTLIFNTLHSIMLVMACMGQFRDFGNVLLLYQIGSVNSVTGLGLPELKMSY
jgi:hypothetical protein